MEVEIHDSKGTNVSKKLKKDQETMIEDSENSGSIAGSTSGSPGVEVINSSNSDMSYHGDENDDDVMDNDDADDVDDSDYDNDDYMFDDIDDDCDYLNMQAQFDNVDLPPGVEASISWLQPSADVNSSKSTSSAATQVGAVAPSEDAKTSAPVHLQPSSGKIETFASSSSLPNVDSSLQETQKQDDEDDFLKKYVFFKSFDIVEDFSDHHYNNMGVKGEQPAKAWTKKIQDEWRILEKDLPGTIFARAYEGRMDLLRAVIEGPQGTPYHDGLFVFDVYFPPNYPHVPPMVYYYSGGLRLNPNLYDCGKVCLSLLNTWTGKGNEKWLPEKSTMLQVLVSIQALILNDKPFFNEPGYDKSYTGATGEKKSNRYNEDVFLLSLKTMMYTLRRPPKHFEDLVAGHFRIHAHDILSACKAYLEGAPVGSVVGGKVQDNEKVKKRQPSIFDENLTKMVNGLISNFTRYGVKDCEKFRLSVEVERL